MDLMSTRYRVDSSRVWSKWLHLNYLLGIYSYFMSNGLNEYSIYRKSWVMSGSRTNYESMNMFVIGRYGNEVFC